MASPAGPGAGDCVRYRLSAAGYEAAAEEPSCRNQGSRANPQECGEEAPGVERRQCRGFRDIEIAQRAADGIGFQVWQCAFALSRYIESNYEVAARRVLELGSGPGLVGVVCAYLGATVTLTDTEDVIPLTRLNVERNASHSPSRGAMSVRDLSWGHDVRETFPAGSFDLVVGSDVTYYEHLHEPLLLSLLQVATQETDVLLAHAHRFESSRPWRECFEFYFDVKLLRTLKPQDIVSQPCLEVRSAASDTRSGPPVTPLRQPRRFGAEREAVPVSIFALRLRAPVPGGDLSGLLRRRHTEDTASLLQRLDQLERDLEKIHCDDT